MCNAEQIKDGIDVSQCECYLIEYNSCNDTLSGSCIKEKCQTFRLLQTIKTKEQECEELKEDNKELQYQLRCTTGREKEWERNCKFWDARCEKLQTELDQLKAENDELKKWKETVVELFERTCRCKYLNEENNHCSFYNRKCIGRLNQCLYKNQQTLTEIKEIAEELKIFYEELGKCEGLTVVQLKQILQKNKRGEIMIDNITPEKQIELIKFIISHWTLYQWVDDEGYSFETRLYPTDRYICYKHKDYTQALAGFVTKLTAYTHETFVEEIKRILQ